ncbi:MAG: hypothetical protein CVV49_05425 [Spirochaetae bacterium HGW-Spirochaetae-5]|nr:MAG: hypothetical protein CVV49_05425 [Spirochaetae bacterium HGW-Spirochaetae-5]
MKKTGIVLSILLFLVTVQSTFFYLFIQKVRFHEWVLFNACAPSSLAYLTGFTVYLFNNDKTFIYLGILPMFFFGTLGMFVIPWGGMNIIPQIGHIIMTLNILWLSISTFKEKVFKSATIGLFLSIFLFSIFIGIQQTYVKNHQDDFQKILMIK